MTVDNFGKTLKLELKRKNITHKDFAEKLGVSPITVYKWIKGDFSPHLYLVIDTANLLDVDIKYLITGE